MLLKLLAISGAMACLATSVQAQRVSAPKELPPAGFSGMQYVDSRGCVFFRAGIGGRVNWVARISASRKPICGLPPTRWGVAPSSVAADTAARADRVPPKAGSAVPSAATRIVVRQPDMQALMPEPVVPTGYKKAWKDDRLNPWRGVGTAAGQAAQDEVWTRDVPQRLIRPKKSTLGARGTVVTSSSNAPRVPATSGPFYVQVGRYGVASNAANAGARLSRMGFRVASSLRQVDGAPIRIVMAGPFVSRDQARSALSAARRDGFDDAFIR